MFPSLATPRHCLEETIGSLRNYYGYDYGYGNEHATKGIGFNEQTDILHVRYNLW